MFATNANITFQSLQNIMNISCESQKAHSPIYQQNKQTFFEFKNKKFYSSKKNIPFPILFIQACEQLKLINTKLLQSSKITQSLKEMERIKFQLIFIEAEKAFVLYKKTIKNEFEKNNFMFENRVIVPIEKSEFFMREILFQHILNVSHKIQDIIIKANNNLSINFPKKDL